MSSENSYNVKSNKAMIDKIFDRVFTKTLGEEGYYEDNFKKIDQPTNMGIIQSTLDRFKSAHPSEASSFPKNIKDLTKDQVRQIARKDFFEKYRIAEIRNERLQETIFDTFFNHSPTAPSLWIQKAINVSSNIKIKEDGIFGSETIEALNKLSSKEIKAVNNIIVDMRHADYEHEKKTNKNPYYQNYTVGLPHRFDRFRIK